MVRLSSISAFLLLTLAFIMASAEAQSLKLDNPAPLLVGINHATSDSFVGEHFWTFTAHPGKFRLIFKRSGPKEGFAVGGKAGIAAVFAPSTSGAVINFKDNDTGTLFVGSVKQPTRVVIMIEPPKSPLVRQTTPYTLEATGDVSFSGVKS